MPFRLGMSHLSEKLSAWITFFALIFCLSFPFASFPSESSPREQLASLNSLRLNPEAVYTISPNDRIEFHHADVVFSLSEGKVAFFQPYQGHITGAVFSGLGHVLALPRDPAEKQQLARFLGAPILDQQFVSGYFRFTDETAQALLDEFKRAGLTPAAEPAFTSLWFPQLERLNPSHSLRVLLESYSSVPAHFFHAAIDGIICGPFDILSDDMRPENLMIGQPHRAGNVQFYDTWASYSLPGFVRPQLSFHATHYQIDSVIRPDNSLEASTSVDFQAASGAEQIVFIQLSRALKVDSITLNNAAQLAFFQNEGLTEQELRARGDDTLCIFLPARPAPGDSFSLQMHYRGNVIENAGNGVLVVGAHESWYPHYGDSSQFALYDLALRWPKRLRLVATGDKLEEHEEGDQRAGRWKTSQPVTEAGFNLGEYAVASIASVNYTIDVYANRQLEAALQARMGPAVNLTEPFRVPGSSDRPQIEDFPLPSPADALKQLGREIDASIRFYEQYNGPFPFRNLGVSQIPGTFGQGWPGLLYLSTFSFLPQSAQQRAGLSRSAQEHFTELVPFHEVAHQWWGNVVGWSSYRDQWLNEAIATYLSLLFLESQKNSDHPLHDLLDHDRKRLVTKSEQEDIAPADIGSLTMGPRLSSSKSPDAYGVLVYMKGAWILHMIREMLRQPGVRDPDARFIALLRNMETKYTRKALSTEQFQRELEGVMTPQMDLEGGRSMEWFFDEYVRGTGVPHYKVEFSNRRGEKGIQIHGKLLQYGVPRSFIAPVPLYAAAGPGRTIYLGTVVTTGEETAFSFNSQVEARKILIDPRMTLLCIPE
jgi:Peptidase family M1 domain